MAACGPQKVHSQAYSPGHWQNWVPGGLLDWGPQVLTGCWVQVLSPCRVGLSIGLLDMAAGFAQNKQAGKWKRWAIRSHSLCVISEMTSCQFYYTLLSRGKLLDPAHTQEERMSQRHKNQKVGPSLVVPWMRICLPVQGTRVRSLAQEDSTCCGATKPVCHSPWACTLEPALYKRSHCKENSVHFSEEEPPFARTRENPRAATKTHCSQKQTNKNKNAEGRVIGRIFVLEVAHHAGWELVLSWIPSLSFYHQH